MAGKINVPVAVAVQGIANAQKQFQLLGKSVGGVGKAAGVAAISFAGFLAGVKAADFAISAVAGARDLERNLAGLKTVFEGTTPQMVAFSKSATDVGLSMSEAAKSSTFIGSVLKQSGFEIQETADLTERLTKLATDLSITYGYDVQEALLGMTALFRGEYDPIEKFGVAMKQSEINSELMAQGLNHLEGAERRFAEQQIRVNLLFERSSDAQGAMARQSGTLAVEQLKLAATFGNVRDTVADELLPVLAEMSGLLRNELETFQPVLKEAFDELAPVLRDVAQTLIPQLLDGLTFLIELAQETVQLVGDMFNPMTRIGESLAALGIQVESIFFAITGNKLELESVFDIIAEIIRFISDLVHDVLYTIENLIIGFKVMGEYFDAIFSGDLVRAFTMDLAGMIEGQIASKDAFNAQMLAAQQFNHELGLVEASAKRAADAFRRTASDTETSFGYQLGKLYEDTGLTGSSGTTTTTTTGKGAAKNFVKDFFDGLQEEIEKQQARIKLNRLGLSEGLINDILGSQGWEKVFASVIGKGVDGLQKLQDQFNKTAAGIKELEAQRAEQLRVAAEAAEEAQRQLDELTDAYEQVLSVIADFKAELEEVSKIDILPTYEEDLGRFESAVVSSFDRIKNTLQDGFVSGAILQDDLNELNAWANAEAAILRGVSAQRDELANRYDLASALISEYRQAFTGAIQLTGIISQLENKTREMTVTEVTEGVTSIGDSLKDLRFSLTRSYTETIEETVDASKALVNNFQNVAAKARTFADNLRKLRDMGLDPQLFSQLVQAGVEAGGETAQALVDGGSGTINEINTLFQEIDSLGKDLGEDVATSLYGTGIDMADGLLAGILSKQGEMEQAARTLAEAFKTTFDTAVGVATERSAATAQMPVLNAELDALKTEQERIQQRIAENEAVLTGGTAGPKAREWAEKKLASYQEQLEKVVGGITEASTAIGNAQTAIGAELSLPSSSAMLTTQSAPVTNNFTVNVTASTRMQGSKAGEAVVQELLNFQNSNGSINSILVG